jgi:uncharacterized protein YceH (UPF0502 family)
MLAVRIDVPGNRVHKYRHNAADTLKVRTGEMAIIAELLLRGPQTLGELRGRASRMSPLESLETAENMLSALMSREEPLARKLPPSPGSRAERYVQLLCPDLHPLEAAASLQPVLPPSAAGDPSLTDRVARLESEVSTLKAAIRHLAEALGETQSVKDIS